MEFNFMSGVEGPLCITLSSDDEMEENDYNIISKSRKAKYPRTRVSTGEVSSTICAPRRKRSVPVGLYSSEKGFYKCHYCDRIYCSKGGLYVHVSRVHNRTKTDFSEKCGKCGKCFETQLGLKLHKIKLCDKKTTPKVKMVEKGVQKDKIEWMSKSGEKQETPPVEIIAESFSGIKLDSKMGTRGPDMGGEGHNPDFTRGQATPMTYFQPSYQYQPVSYGGMDLNRYGTGSQFSSPGGGGGPVLFYGYILQPHAPNQYPPIQYYPMSSYSPQASQNLHPYQYNLLQASSPQMYNYGVPQGATNSNPYVPPAMSSNPFVPVAANSNQFNPAASGSNPFILAAAHSNQYIPAGTSTNQFIPATTSNQFSGLSGKDSFPFANPLPTKLCSFCSSQFQSEIDLRFHIQNVHPEKSWKCPICSELMLSSEELTQHFAIRHHHPTC